jgi:hypothetical protein
MNCQKRPPRGRSLLPRQPSPFPGGMGRPEVRGFCDRLRKEDGMGRKPSRSMKWIVSTSSPFQCSGCCAPIRVP